MRVAVYVLFFAGLALAAPAPAPAPAPVGGDGDTREALDALFRMKDASGNQGRLAVYKRVLADVTADLHANPAPQAPNPTTRSEYVRLGEQFMRELNEGKFTPITSEPVPFAVCLGFWVDTTDEATVATSLQRLFLLHESWLADFPHRYIYANIAIPRLNVRKAWYWTGGQGVYQFESMISIPLCRALFPNAARFIISDEDVVVNKDRLLGTLPDAPTNRAAVYGCFFNPSVMFWGVFVINQAFVAPYTERLVEVLGNGYTNAFIPGSMFHNDHLLSDLLRRGWNTFEHHNWLSAGGRDLMDFDAVHGLDSYTTRRTSLVLYHHIKGEFLRRYLQEWRGHPRPLYCADNTCGFRSSEA